MVVTLVAVFQFTGVGKTVCIPPEMSHGSGPQYTCSPALSPSMMIGAYLVFVLGAGAILVGLIGLRRLKRSHRTG